MRRAAVALVAAWLGVIALVAASESARAAALTGAMLLLVALAALAATGLAVRHRRALGSLNRQFAVGAAIVVGQTAVAIVLFAALMFLSGHDALLVCVVVAFTGLVGAVAARALAVGVGADIRALRDALGSVAEGDRDGHVRTGGRDELAELADAANAMVGQLAAEEGARRALVAAVSHDLRTPITSLRLLAEAFGDGLVAPDERQVYLERMRTHLAALGGLIDDLFELSRLEAGEVRWSLQRVHLAMLLGDTVDAIRPQADAKGVRIGCDVASDLPPAYADPEKLQRVLFNLVQNAIRHTPADGSVMVLAEPGGDGLEVEVADTGDGIAACERARVFDAFFRGGRAAARPADGAGLGLAISRAIVEAHGGRIWIVDSGVGARVRFSLRVAA